MQSISARVDDETHDELEAIAEERGSSTSAVVRELINKGLGYDDLEAERDRLQRQLAATNARQDDVTELVEYVEQQREAERYRDRRQRQLDEANVLQRAAWWFTGVPVEDGER